TTCIELQSMAGISRSQSDSTSRKKLRSSFGSTPSMRLITRSTTRLIQQSMCADLLRQPAASTRRRLTWLPKQETPLASAQLRPCGRRATCSSQRASDSEWQVVVATNCAVRDPGDEQFLATGHRASGRPTVGRRRAPAERRFSKTHRVYGVHSEPPKNPTKSLPPFEWCLTRQKCGRTFRP